MGRLLSKYAGTQFSIYYSSVKANTCSKLLLAFLVAISNNTTGNHIPSKTVWTVFLAPGQSNSKTFVCHTRKLERLLSVHHFSLRHTANDQLFMKQYISLATSYPLFCHVRSFVVRQFLSPSCSSFLHCGDAIPTHLWGKFVIMFTQKLILLGSFSGLPFFVFRQTDLLAPLM